MNTLTYRALLDGVTYRYIGFSSWYIFLAKTNFRRVRCRECNSHIEPNGCVHHRSYGGYGYICLPCAKRLIHRYGQSGFHVNILLNLQAAHDDTGKYTARQVADSIQLFHVKHDPNGLEILTQKESP